MDQQKVRLNADFSNKSYTTYKQKDVDDHMSFRGIDGQIWEVYAVSGDTEADSAPHLTTQNMKNGMGFRTVANKQHTAVAPLERTLTA